MRARVAGPRLTSLRPASAAAWTPADLSPWAWYDASDTATITHSGGAVSQWSDKSGNARHVTQGTGTNQPTTGTRTMNGLNVIDFNADDFLAGTGTLSQPFTIYAVIHSDFAGSGGSLKRYFDGYNGSDGSRAIVVENNPNWNLFDGSALVNTTRANSIGDKQHVTVWNGGSSAFYENGTQYGGTLNTGTVNIDKIIFSTDGVTTGFAWWDGTIAEIVIDDAAASAGNRTDWNTYCARWGL